MDILFSLELFWFQIHNLPLAVLSQEVMSEQICYVIGKVLVVDVDKEEVDWGKCLRIRVEVPLSKPQLRGKRFSVGDKQFRLTF